jgi:hypothetical protein
LLAAPFGEQSAAPDRRRQREPPNLAFCPSDLPVKKSRSTEVARSRYVSFCDSSCDLAAQFHERSWQLAVRETSLRSTPRCFSHFRRLRRACSSGVDSVRDNAIGKRQLPTANGQRPTANQSTIATRVETAQRAQRLT